MKDTSILDDNELVKLVKEDNSGEALKELIERHSGIFYSICKRTTKTNKGNTYSEISDSKDYVIYSAAESYNPDMGSKFSTWLANQTRYFCLNFLCKESKYVPISDMENEDYINSFIDNKSQENFEEERAKESLNSVIDFVKDEISHYSDPKIRRVVMEKYFSKTGEVKTFTEIAGEMDTTVQTVINWHNKFIKFIKNKIDIRQKNDTLYITHEELIKN
jgi:RNA polymerase sigma factor (sigma-70 family)